MFLTYPQNIPMLCQIIAITAHNIPVLQTKQYIIISPHHHHTQLMITNLISADLFFSPDLYLKF